jgi:RNA polymerase sigma factor (sigma-70 family)
VNESAFDLERLLREVAPQALGAVARRHRDFVAAEDAMQEALIAAATQWPREGVPDNPRGWLIHVASRRLTDQARSEMARRAREEAVAADTPRVVAQGLAMEVSLAGEVDRALGATGPGPRIGPRTDDADDTLTLLFLCCHPSLSVPSAIALTLRAVGGLTTEQIAAAFLVPLSTVAQRISRAKQTIRSSGVPFRLPEPAAGEARLAAVLHVLYLMFNEGYTASAGRDLQRLDLAAEAIRLAREVHRRLPDHGGVGGLLGLLLLTHARRFARTGPAGELVALDEQDRSRWDRAMIGEGKRLVERSFACRSAGEPVSEYAVQAAIAALHDEAPSVEATDWPQIRVLYEVLLGLADNPMTALNHAVAIAMVEGPAAGLARLEALAADPRLAAHHRLDAVRAHLLERRGEGADRAAAIAAFRAAAAKTTSIPERDYLVRRAARLAESG